VELKEAVAELTLENRLLKKSMTGDGATRHEIYGLEDPGRSPFRIKEHSLEDF
jgi:hypothetical protein